MLEIVFVCSGNTCRSPMAQFLMQKALASAPFALPVHVSSCGLATADGLSISDYAAEALRECGIEAVGFTSSAARRELFENADIIVCMTASHAAGVWHLCPESAGHLMAMNVSDPYGGDLATYRRCRDEIAAGIGALIRTLDAHIEGNVSFLPLKASQLDEAARAEEICFSVPWSRRMLADEIALDYATILAATLHTEKEQKLVGYCGCRWIPFEMEITNVAVLPEYRRMGLGRKLLGRLLAQAQDREVERVTLEVRSRNEPAKALYAGFGFAPCGIRPGYYHDPDDDAIIMEFYPSKEA